MFWFALQVRRRYERLAARALCSKGYEEFLPTCRCSRRWSDRVRIVDSPLFPGYVFCKLDPAVRLGILTTPSVVSIEGIGKVPVPVGDCEISAIQTIVNTRLAVEPWPYFQHGECVRIDTGPLRGVDGTARHECRDDRISRA